MAQLLSNALLARAPRARLRRRREGEGFLIEFDPKVRFLARIFTSINSKRGRGTDTRAVIYLLTSRRARREKAASSFLARGENVCLCTVSHWEKKCRHHKKCSFTFLFTYGTPFITLFHNYPRLGTPCTFVPCAKQRRRQYAAWCWPSSQLSPPPPPPPARCIASRRRRRTACCS